jgi:hypothetical protein
MREKGFRLAGRLNSGKYLFKISFDLLVGGAYHPVPLRFHFPATTGVGIELSEVDASIDLDDQARLGAVKVNDVGTNLVKSLILLMIGARTDLPLDVSVLLLHS